MEELAAVFGEKDAGRLVKGTGVKERRIDRSLCTSDLCVAAAEKLISELGWERSSIQHLVFITQSPDYRLPATSCVIQQRLGLSTDCTAFDVNLGCSGYTYGIWLTSKLLEPGQRALLLAGDTSSAMVGAEDRSAAPLFGDCGTATAFEFPADGDALNEIAFIGGTNGAGHSNIIIPAGGYREKSSPMSCAAQKGADGNLRTSENLHMNGPEVFSFGIREVPPLIQKCLTLKGWDASEVDALVFHQANAFMLSTIASKVGIPMEKVPMSIDWYGNTSSASIPLTMTVCLREALTHGGAKLLLAGFGVGWSWAALALQPGPMVMPALVEV
ncbi:ketoacyl-ACP synthase III [Prosthecobacter sp. SYSU 5D2]|uniref:ketoacyl-ACP synthase III n=1 Tax=Prosthecobacter sp. SYSU 5D2 TaxID=3134134 RepID=UPI0031FF324E